jgi:hypothetical protein
VTASIGFISGIVGLLTITEPERGRFDISASVVANNEISQSRADSNDFLISADTREQLHINQISD